MTSRWLASSGETWKRLPEIRREELRNWLRMNGVDPYHVPVDSDVTVREISPGTWVIDYEAHVLTEDGRVQVSPTDPDDVYVQAKTTPLEINPPMYLLTPVED
jgi:hypothetical protein